MQIVTTAPSIGASPTVSHEDVPATLVQGGIAIAVIIAMTWFTTSLIKVLTDFRNSDS